MALILPKDIVSRIKEETDIVGVVRGYLTLKPAGSGFKGLCPFHREKTPSFHINPDLQIYKCFGCGEGGDVISFVMKVEGITFPEALEALARPLDIDLSRFLREQDESEGERLAFHRANEIASQAWQDALWQDMGRKALQYLQQRGFSEEILRRYEVGYAPPGTDWFQQALQRGGVSEELARRAGLLRQNEAGGAFAYFRSRIIFPIKNIAQRVTGFGGRILGQGEPKYLNSSDSSYFSKGKLLYGFASSRMSIARMKTAILVEGYLDLLALAQAGFGNAVATCGTAFTPDQAKLLRRGCRAIVLLFDGDRAGLQAAIKGCHVALANGLEPKVARLDSGEDPASFLMTRDREAMQEVLAGSHEYLPLLLSLAEEKGGNRQVKERALRQGLKSIAVVEDPIRQEYLLQDAADLFGISLDILRDHLQREQQQQHRRSEAGAKGERAAPSGPAKQKGSIRSFAAVNRPAIEATLLAHVLRDESGRAACLLLREGDEDLFTSPEARMLRQELAVWRGEHPESVPPSPAGFVQERWHAKAEAYRTFVTSLLTEEVVPDQTDFERVVKDCLMRLSR